MPKYQRRDGTVIAVLFDGTVESADQVKREIAKNQRELNQNQRQVCYIAGGEVPDGGVLIVRDLYGQRLIERNRYVYRDERVGALGHVDAHTFETLYEPQEHAT